MLESMSKIPRRPLEYAVAVLAVGVAIVVRWLVDPLVGHRLPFPTILGAVAVAVGFGGLYPALLAIALGYVGINFMFIDPRGAVLLQSRVDWITLAGYLFACFTVTLFGLLMRREQRRYQAAAAALAELNQRKDEQLATVAHELRNPLGPIRTAMDVLTMQGSVSGRELRLASDMIDRQLGHLTRLIDDLVDIDRIARNQLELRKERVSLETIVDRAVEVIRTPMAHHELIVNVPKQPIFLEADPERLGQVLVNLLGNALKFTPAGGRIELTVEAQGGMALLRVKDTGAGISPDALPRVFELFYQGDRGQRGLGIGLSLVRQLVAMHGGTVSAHSAGTGRGSEFVVRLPLCADQGPDRGQPASVESSPLNEGHAVPVA
jgi:signal transduction histidine kinase